MAKPAGLWFSFPWWRWQRKIFWSKTMEIWEKWSYCCGWPSWRKSHSDILSGDHPDCLWVVKRPDRTWSGLNKTKYNISEVCRAATEQIKPRKYFPAFCPLRVAFKLIEHWKLVKISQSPKLIKMSKRREILSKYHSKNYKWAKF